jgi:hypothetical protein
MSYKTVSYTSSGWEISNDPLAPCDKQWRIQHAQWGTKFFPSRDEARDAAFRIAFEKARELMTELGLPGKGNGEKISDR